MTSARRLIEAIKTEITPARSPSPTSYMQLIEIFPLQSITSKNQHKAAVVLVEKLITRMQADDVKEALSQSSRCTNGMVTSLINS